LRAFWKTRAASGVKVFCEPEKGAGGELAYTVGEVEPGSEEALAGIQLGDRLLEQDGQPMSRIKSLEELRDLKRQLVAGQETVWLLARGDQRLQVRFVRPAGSPAWVEEQVRADLKRLAARR
jgi:S1-C subfamily serine protease